MPYIYTMAGKTYFDDYTIMRPLIMDFSKDKKVENIGDQFMFGPSIMVCPVYEYEQRNRSVYFPEGANWYNFYTGAEIKGGQKLNVDAPYDRIPLYVREGSIIPIGPDIEYTDEKLADTIVLYVYKGQNGNFTLYEDEGVNYNYEKGNFSNIPITYNNNENTLTIGQRTGEFKGMLKNRKFVIKTVSKENPNAFNYKAEGQPVAYNGELITIQLN